jgi:AcrR family transcriptional regulator
MTDVAVGTRQAAAARTRALLVDAGLRLADTTGLSELSIDRIVAEAGVSKGTFFYHFTDRAGYLLAIHRGFHDRLAAEIEGEVAAMPPGRSRLVTGATVYLDRCLHDRGVRALLLDARAEPLVADEVQHRNRATAERCVSDFAAIGRAHPKHGADLWVRLVAEAAILELRAHRRQPQLRAALWEFLDV